MHTRSSARSFSAHTDYTIVSHTASSTHLSPDCPSKATGSSTYPSQSSSSASSPVYDTSETTPEPSISDKSPNSLKNSRKRPTKSAKVETVSKHRPNRAIKLQDLKERAYAIPSTGKIPVDYQRRIVLEMVFEQITPYPCEAWISILSVLLDRNYVQVRNWFSNQRQSSAREMKKSDPDYDLQSLVSTVICNNRRISLRPEAILYAEPKGWTDDFFEEVVMIHNVKTRMDLIRRGELDIRVVPGQDS